jgi:hypothetical protein
LYKLLQTERSKEHTKQAIESVMFKKFSKERFLPAIIFSITAVYVASLLYISTHIQANHQDDVQLSSEINNSSRIIEYSPPWRQMLALATTVTFGTISGKLSDIIGLNPMVSPVLIFRLECFSQAFYYETHYLS